MFRIQRYIILTYILLSIYVLKAQAQYKLVVYNIQTIGNCSGLGGKINVKVLEAQANERNGKVYDNKSLCESSLHNLSNSYDGCTVKTIGACISLGDNGSSASGGSGVLGPSQGTSFYSANPASEIKDWSSDDMERMIKFDQRFKNEQPTFVTTNDAQFNNALVIDTNRPFRSLNIDEIGAINTYSADFSMREGFKQVEMANDFSHLANKENVQRYLDATNSGLAASYIKNPQDLTQLLHMEFKAVSGFDLDAIMQKLPSERTVAEKQALIDYQEYRKEVTDKMIVDIDKYVATLPETKNFEMAVLAENCYKDSEHAFLSQTNYKEVGTDYFKEGSPMRGLSELIDECNATNANTGFHAEIYFNETTNEYTIAFEGTNGDEWADINTDYELGTGLVPEQYVLANKIAEFLNSSSFSSEISINITGHSLGGGLASIVGLATGKPTYTFNAAGISENAMNTFNLKDKSAVNIKAFQDYNDVLTFFQEGIVGKPVAIGVASAVSYSLTNINEVDGIMIPGRNNSMSNIEGQRIQKELLSGNVAAPTVGNKIEVEGGGWHLVKPMVNVLMEKRNGTIQPYLHHKNTIYDAGHGVEYQTQESIQIFTGN